MSLLKTGIKRLHFAKVTEEKILTTKSTQHLVMKADHNKINAFSPSPR